MAIASTDHRAALVFQNIEITRMDGVRDSFGIDSLSPGINLIHGPNGIGKSRTATALQALIWPDATSSRAEVIGTFRVADNEWRVDLDAGRVHYQRDGIPGHVPEFANLADPHRDRYLLTLQDLLQVENRNFAREIQREAAGGYDLVRVGDELRTRSGRPSGAIKDLRDAESEVSRLRREDSLLRNEELSLADVRKELDGAIDAGERVRMLEAARDYAEARDRLQEARIAREAFADPLGRMSGVEYRSLQDLQEQLRAQEARRSKLAHEISQRTRDLERTGLSEMSVPATLVSALRERLAKLQGCESEWRRARQDMEKSSSVLESCRVRLGEHITDEQLAALDSDGLRQLSHLTRQFWQADVEHHAQEAVRDWLGTISAPTDLDRLRRGVDLLSRYLQVEHAADPDHSTLARWTMLGAAGLIAVLSMLLAIQVQPLYLVLALFAVPVVWVSLRRGTPTGPETGHIREEYTRLGLQLPHEWTRQQVMSTIASVQEGLASANLDQEKHQRWGALDARRARLEEQYRTLDTKRRELLATLGVVPEDQDPESLRLIASALDAWRDASDSLAQAEATVHSTALDIAGLLASINEALGKYGVPQAADTSEASAAIEELADRITGAEQLRSSLQHSSHLLEEEIEPRITELEDQVATIFRTLDIDEGDENRLRDLCDSVEACRKAQRALEHAEIVVKTARARLDNASDYESLSREEIERRLMEAENEASRRDEIQARISTIEASLRQARQQTTLEQAVAAQSDAVEALADSRHQAYEAAAANRVLAFIRDRNDERNRPAVFGVADEYFRLFTAGAYRLGLTDGNTPEFLAIDTETGGSLELDQLSSGTRVQLLLAVRLAFIESAEHGPRLPLILDETLGNTDDLRASAIIDAAVEIARRGRPVIYFTAQRDEIAKWCARLDDQSDGPPWRVFNLALIRGDARAEVAPLLDWNREIFDTIDIPEDAGYHQLQSLLGVPAVDMWAEGANGVDPWYLIPDIEPLMTLRKRGVRTWGQYLSLHKTRDLDGIGTGVLHERASARALIIETVCREWRRGRPKPLTKQFLHTSEFISDTYRERVEDCAERHGWNGFALIQALRDGEVSGFWRAKIDGLEESFREHGYLTDTGPLPHNMIRARAFSIAASSIEQEVIDAHEVDRLLMSLTGETHWLEE